MIQKKKKGWSRTARFVTTEFDIDCPEDLDGLRNVVYRL